MWPFRRRDRQKMKDSQQALLDASESLHQVEARSKEVREISGALRNIRERNHFAEQLRVIMERG